MRKILYKLKNKRVLFTASVFTVMSIGLTGIIINACETPKGHNQRNSEYCKENPGTDGCSTPTETDGDDTPNQDNIVVSNTPTNQHHGKKTPQQHLVGGQSTDSPTGTEAPNDTTGNGESFTAYITSYGGPDNDCNGEKAGCIDRGVIHNHAGGTGTIDDPITFAVDPNSKGGQIAKKGDMFFVKGLNGNGIYIINEDSCAKCQDDDNGNKYPQFDVWAGINASESCEDNLTKTYTVTKVTDRSHLPTGKHDSSTNLCKGSDN